MGKRRDEFNQKVAAFEEEMKAFAERHGKKFGMAKRVRNDLWRAASENNMSVDAVIADLRQGLMDAILNAPEEFNLPEKIPPLN